MKFSTETMPDKRELVLWLVGFGLLFPIFFQLSGHIYNSSRPLLDSGGVLATLPLPISIITSYGGIALLIGNYQRAILAWMFLGLMLFMMIISMVLTSVGTKVEPGKLMLLIQFMLPAFGMALGQLIEESESIFSRVFLYILLAVVPIQLVATWTQGSYVLTHNLYLFGIYQHLQFVPLIFVCAFSYSMINLWNSHKKIFYFLIPIMFIYSIASTSFLTIFAYVAFISTFTYLKFFKRIKRAYLVIMAILLLAGVVSILQGYYKLTESYSLSDQDGHQVFTKFHDLASGKLPANIEERMVIFKLYGSDIFESGKTLLFGHNLPMPRKLRSSAHNWYLDMTYNFGLISLLPIIVLCCYTAHITWKSRGALSGETIWLAGIVFYLVVIDNNFKVTLRQPYPGIFAYFMWGLLLSMLTCNHLKKAEI